MPPGTCLFDRASGDVVGVQTTAKQRLGHRVDEEWPDVYVGTPWGTRTVYLHLTDRGLESCLP